MSVLEEVGLGVVLISVAVALVGILQLSDPNASVDGRTYWALSIMLAGIHMAVVGIGLMVYGKETVAPRRR